MLLIGSFSDANAASARSQTPEIVIEYEYAENSQANADRQPTGSGPKHLYNNGCINVEVLLSLVTGSW